VSEAEGRATTGPSSGAPSSGPPPAGPPPAEPPEAEPSPAEPPEAEPSQPHPQRQPEDRDGTFGRLFARRSVWLRSALDHDAASRLAAELLALDAESHEPIELVVNSAGGPVDAALGVIDTMDLVEAPVATLCIGQALGTAAGVLACGRSGRRATPTARLSLRLGSAELTGTASQLRGQAQHLLDLRDRLALRLATATGQLPALIVIDLDDGGFMSADQAVGYGLIDQVAERR
jgi:ATP-dependent Clp protease, protease subunit